MTPEFFPTFLDHSSLYFRMLGMFMVSEFSENSADKIPIFEQISAKFRSFFGESPVIFRQNATGYVTCVQLLPASIRPATVSRTSQ